MSKVKKSKSLPLVSSEKKLDKIIERFLNETKELKSFIHNLQHKIFDSFNGQIKKDFNSLEKASDKLISITQNVHQKILNSYSLTDTEWSILRHDLKAMIGAIKGYSELITEELEDLNESKLKSSFKLIINQSIKLLPHIDIMGPSLKTKQNNADNTKITPGKYPSTILIIDDSDHKREVFSRRLIQMGHTVITADNGLEGLEKLKTEKIDLILLDILMPGMSGYEVLKVLKENQLYREIPVLIISSVSETTSVINCITAGADDYLPTPVNTVFLQARISACLEKKHLRDRERQQHEELDRTRTLLLTSIESVDEGFVVYDKDDNMVLYNQKFAHLYRLPPLEEGESFSYINFLKANLNNKLYKVESFNDDTVEFIDPINPEEWMNERLKLHKELKGSYRERLSMGHWIEVIENRLPDGGIVAIHKDITQEVEKQKRMSFLATHDPLTKLGNRRSFEKVLQETFVKSRQTDEQFAIFYIDLDDFKHVNDSYGHEVGDYMLQEVAKRLKKCFRSSDYVARLGGDEFSVIVTNIISSQQLSSFAQRVMKSVGNEIIFNNKKITFGLSIGAAMFPEHGTLLKDLLKCADSAMYQAKKAGKGQFLLAKSKS